MLNCLHLIRNAALNGYELAYLPLDVVQADLEHSHLVQALATITPALSGYHLYYPNQQASSTRFQAVRRRRCGIRGEAAVAGKPVFCICETRQILTKKQAAMQFIINCLRSLPLLSKTQKFQ